MYSLSVYKKQIRLSGVELITLLLLKHLTFTSKVLTV